MTNETASTGEDLKACPLRKIQTLLRGVGPCDYRVNDALMFIADELDRRTPADAPGQVDVSQTNTTPVDVSETAFGEHQAAAPGQGEVERCPCCRGPCTVEVTPSETVTIIDDYGSEVTVTKFGEKVYRAATPPPSGDAEELREACEEEVYSDDCPREVAEANAGLIVLLRNNVPAILSALRPSTEGETAELVEKLRDYAANGYRHWNGIQSVFSKAATLITRQASEIAALRAYISEAPASPSEEEGAQWPEDWKINGFNGAFRQAIRALCYLAEHDRPQGGEQFPNSACCYMIADELETTRKRYAALRTGAVPGEGEAIECHGLDTPDRVCFYEQDFYVLSNFSSFTLQWMGIRFDTLEAAYHWEKFAHGFTALDGHRAAVAEAIRNAASAHVAFQIAQEHKDMRRPDWNEVKVPLMATLLRAKVDQHEYVHRKLLATGDRELVENSWRDDFWGWGPNRDGQNMLGKLWMEIRAELRASPPPPSPTDTGEPGA